LIKPKLRETRPWRGEKKIKKAYTPGERGRRKRGEDVEGLKGK